MSLTSCDENGTPPRCSSSKVNNLNLSRRKPSDPISNYQLETIKIVKVIKNKESLRNYYYPKKPEEIRRLNVISYPQ
jgi:hypothetical protein